MGLILVSVAGGGGGGGGGGCILITRVKSYKLQENSTTEKIPQGIEIFITGRH